MKKSIEKIQLSQLDFSLIINHLMGYTLSNYSRIWIALWQWASLNIRVAFKAFKAFKVTWCGQADDLLQCKTFEKRINVELISRSTWCSPADGDCSGLTPFPQHGRQTLQMAVLLCKLPSLFCLNFCWSKNACGFQKEENWTKKLCVAEIWN